jgi:hypothetical protein
VHLQYTIRGEKKVTFVLHLLKVTHLIDMSNIGQLLKFSTTNLVRHMNST